MFTVLLPALAMHQEGGDGPTYCAGGLETYGDAIGMDHHGWMVNPMDVAECWRRDWDVWSWVAWE